MSITPLLGATRSDVRGALRAVHNRLEALVTNQQMHPGIRAHKYFDWVGFAAHQLHAVLGKAEIDRLILTDRYYHLLAGHTAGSSPFLIQLLEVEMHNRHHEIHNELTSLEQQIQSWSGPERFIAFDTNVFLEHAEKLEDIDFGAIAPSRVRDPWTGSLATPDPSTPVHLLVPMMVVDELDKSKRTETRWRAAYSLAKINQVLPDPRGQGVLREAGYLGADGQPRGKVTVEILLDDPGHVRMPIEDDEIIDRVAAAQTLAGRPITLVTHDTGCSMRARAVGLSTEWLERPKPEKPDNEVKQKAGSRRSRRNGSAATG